MGRRPPCSPARRRRSEYRHDSGCCRRPRPSTRRQAPGRRHRTPRTGSRRLRDHACLLRQQQWAVKRSYDCPAGESVAVAIAVIVAPTKPLVSAPVKNVAAIASAADNRQPLLADAAHSRDDVPTTSDGVGSVTDDVKHEVRVRQHGDVTAVQLVRRGAHPIRAEPFEVRIHGPVVVGDDVPTWL